LIASQHCNGSRVPPEVGGNGAFNVPNEGNNWINMAWGPLSLVSPKDNETVLGNYALTQGSMAIDYACQRKNRRSQHGFLRQCETGHQQPE
jgi:hypothetical protein